jgi:hypothetical protein
MQHHVRQGDVLLMKVDGVPAKTKQLSTKIVAYGEVTGHAHRIEADAGDVVLVEDEEGNMFVRVKDSASIRHEEHGAIKLGKGDYKVVHQREYSPEAIRPVLD